MLQSARRSRFIILSALRSFRKSNDSLQNAAAKGFSGLGTREFSSLSSEASSSNGSARRVMHGGDGLPLLSRGCSNMNHVAYFRAPFQVANAKHASFKAPYFARMFASKASESSSGQKQSEGRKEVSSYDDPFDAPTYNIPEKPVSFTEGASYSIAILAGLGVAAAAGYAVFKELIFQPKEYKIFGKALDRVQNDSQVRARIGSPITGYGSESRNRAARQRIPHRMWTDEDGVEHVEVNFYIRGPHGAGKVFAEMFQNKEEKQWKFTYLVVEIRSPSRTQLMLESYVPA